MARDGDTPRLDRWSDRGDASGESTERAASGDEVVGDDGTAGDDEATTGDGGTSGGSPTDGSVTTDDNATADEPSGVSRVDHPETRAEAVELGVSLLAGLADDSLSVKEALDRIETVTRDPAVQREILDTAETRGVIAREAGTVQTTSGGAPIRLKKRVFRREGNFECRRCGAGLSTGHFVRFDTGDLGPFGSSCIEKVTGRE